MKFDTVICCSIFLLFSDFVTAQVIVNDEYFENQWYLNMSGNDETRADIRVLDAWQRAMGNSTQKIADIEDANGEYPSLHNDLDENRIIRQGQGGGFISGHHSTMIAGIIMATHNTIGIAGINSYAKLYSYVFDDVDYWGDKIRDARLDGNKVINISQGQPAQLPVEVFNEIVNAHEHNIVTVVSVGNTNSYITNPATYSGVIAVGSSNKDNAKSYFSNSGPQIKFLAPGGTDFSSTNIDNIYSTDYDGSYTYDGGTSLSAPLVSGAASLILDYRPTFTNDDVLNILINSCDKLPEMNGQNFTPSCGYGRINLKKAFELLEPPYQWFSAPATLNKTDSDINVVFENNPYLATGIYIVDRYKLSYDNSNLYFQEPPLAWLERGYSNSNYNYSLDYLSVSTSTNSVHCSTYFYYVKFALDGTPISKWFPYDPYTNTKCTIVGKIEPPTGIEDYILVNVENPQLPYNVNQLYLGRQTEQFIDQEPYGDYIVDWENWKVYAKTTCDNEVLVYENTAGYSSIDIPDLPTSYQWLRDENGNVLASITRNGTDNDNIYHEGSADILIGNVPPDQVSGTLTSDVSWCGPVTVTGNLTIPGGITLYLSPGANISFENNSSLIVNGRLDAQGYTNNKIIFNRNGTSGTWGNLKFDGSSSANSILSNVDIKNGSGVQCLNGANITIQNSLIDHCTQGIYIYGASPAIINNNITDPFGNGIYGETLGYAPLIKGNAIKKITNNLFNYEGIYFTNSSATLHITGNDIQGFDYGFYFGGGGQSYFWDDGYITSNPNNRYFNNRTGFCSAWGSFIIAGAPGTPNYCNNNSIYGNTYYDAKAYQKGTIRAEYNWWGSDGAQLYTATNGTINANNPLTYDPWNTGTPDADSPEGNSILVMNPFGDDDIMQAISLEREGRIAELISLCKQMIRDNGNTNFALSELIYVKIKHHINNIRDYLDSLAIGNRPFKAKLLYYLAGLSLHEGNYNIAWILYNKIINDFPNSREAVDARFEKFFAALNIAENRELAGQLLSELQSLGINDEDFLMRLEMAEYLYNGTSGSHMSKPASSNEGITEVKEYTLFDNYPNPFNPSTTINYQLPQNGFVTLKVYDILGKEVASLVNEQKNQGRYSVNFDASSLASGVYIYQIRVNDFVSSKKMLLLK